MTISIISSVQSMARKLAAAIHGSPSSSSSSDQVLSSMKKDLESLERTLRRIQAVLNDAEEREIGDASIKLWLKELRWVAYDAENVLGEYQYETRRAEIITSETAAETSLKRKKTQDDKVYEFTSVLLQLSIPQRIRDLTKRFEEISKARKDLQLREEDGPRRHSISHVPQPSSSRVDEYGVFGREHEKEKVIQMLLSDAGSRKISVISIVGMGGLGKTTLAQCVYNDPRICQYFDSRGWVCVSEDFDVRRLTGDIIQSITTEPCGLTQSDALQAKLKEIVDGKKVLVVLDDVWNEKPSFWESLKVPFLSAATTKVLVTTRNESVAKIMQTTGNMYQLGCLPEGICWSLFCHHAFSSRIPEEHPRLVVLGRKIVQKCGGLPLAVKTLGSLLLHYEADEETWREVLESEIWELYGAEDDILPALKLSYYRLPAHLKPCFLFTSVYPKDFQFNKYSLIKMWIAQGYILPRRNKRLEDIGIEYFDELQRRSLFLYISYDCHVLHDIVHDLARHVSENEHHFIVLESSGKVSPIPAEVRHLFVRHQQGARFGQLSLENTRDLRTLIVDGDYRFDEVDLQLEHFIHLRVLKMNRGSCNFGNLKHLCYLECNYSKFSTLVEISLEGKVKWVSSIPLGQLPSLKYLRIRHMPCGTMLVGLFPCLEELLFEHSPEWKEWSGVMDGDFPCLRKLTLRYCPLLIGLPMLPSSLESLHIFNCASLKSLPLNHGQVRFPRMKELVFQDMPSWEEWPGLNRGDFPCLCRLTIERCNKLRRFPLLPSSLDKNHVQVGFPCLEELLFVDMWAWEEWSGVRDGDFPCLRELTLRYCPLLIGLPMLPLSLQSLHIFNCASLKSLLLNHLTSLKRLELSVKENHLPSDGWLPPMIQILKVCSCSFLKSLSLHENLLLLTVLEIRTCPLLASFDGLHNLSNLEELSLNNCPKLQFLPNNSLPSSLQSLSVIDCGKLRSLPLLHEKLSLLEKLEVLNCPELTIVDGLHNLSSLKTLIIRQCPVLWLSSDEQLSSMPHRVSIAHCPVLREWCQQQSIPYNQENKTEEEIDDGR